MCRWEQHHRSRDPCKYRCRIRRSTRDTNRTAPNRFSHGQQRTRTDFARTKKLRELPPKHIPLQLPLPHLPVQLEQLPHYSAGCQASMAATQTWALKTLVTVLLGAVPPQHNPLHAPWSQSPKQAWQAPHCSNSHETAALEAQAHRSRCQVESCIVWRSAFVGATPAYALRDESTCGLARNRPHLAGVVLAIAAAVPASATLIIHENAREQQ